MKKALGLFLMLLGISVTVFGENRTIKDGDTVYIKNMGAQQYVAVADSKLVGRSDVKTKFKIKFSDPGKRGNIVSGNIVYFELEGDNGEKFYIGSAGDSPNPIFFKKVKLLGLKDQKYQALYFKISRYASWPSGDVISGNPLLLEVAQYTNYFFRFNLYEGGGNEIFMAPDYTNMNFDRSTKELSLELAVSEPVEKEITKPALPVEPHVSGVPSSDIEESEEEYEETLEDQIDNVKTLKDLEAISKKYPLVLSDSEYKKLYDAKKQELSAIVKKVINLPILKKEAEKSVAANKNVIKKFYTIFNLSDDADEKKIASAYRKLANVFHPEKPLGSIEIFNKIKSAKDILIAYKHFLAQNADKTELELLSKSEVFPKITHTEMNAIEVAGKEKAIVKEAVNLPVLRKEAEKNIQVNKKVIDSFYKIFNLNEYAKVDEITKAFKKLARVFHPDKPQGNKEIYEKIQQAKNVLIALINFKAGKAGGTELKLLVQAEVFPKITQTDMKAIEAAGKEAKEEKPSVETPSWKPGQKPVLDQKGPEVEEKESVSIKWGDEVYIENLKIKKYATFDGDVLVGKKEHSKQASFIIVADMKNPDLSKGQPIKYGKAGYFKFSTAPGFIGDSEEQYTIYGMKRHLLGVVTEKDKIYKFTILPSTGKKDEQPVFYGDKIKLQYKIPTSKSPIKYFRFNVDVSTYKKGTEIFGSDESKLMTALAKKFTKELTFKRASEEKALGRTGLKIGEKFVPNEKGESLISFIKNDFDDVTKMGQIANFLDSGADINYKDKYGKTTLHYAAQMGNLIMVEWLIKSGANPNLKDNDGKMPYDLAKNATVKSFLKSKMK